jgi:hypothetical protein
MLRRLPLAQIGGRLQLGLVLLSLTVEFALPHGATAFLRGAPSNGMQIHLGGARVSSPVASRAPAMPPLSRVSAVPHHLALILDGNGRWASRQGLPRTLGHVQGAGRALEVIQEALDLGIKVSAPYNVSPGQDQRAKALVLSVYIQKNLSCGCGVPDAAIESVACLICRVAHIVLPTAY